MRVPNASVDRYISFVARDSVSLERKLSLTTGDFSVYLSKNASVPSGMTTPSIQEADTGNMPGVYQLLLDEFTNLDDGHDEEEVIINLYGETETLSIDEIPIPDKFTLHQNHPNPFNPSTSMNLHMPVEGNVTVQVYELNGREVQTLLSGMLPKGDYNITWNAARQSSGMYLIRAITAEQTAVQKVLLLK